MTDYKFDPELPFVVVSDVDVVLARTRSEEDADELAYSYVDAKVIDTTPKPVIPALAKTIVWRECFDSIGDYANRYATRYGHPNNGVWQLEPDTRLTTQQLVSHLKENHYDIRVLEELDG